MHGRTWIRLTKNPALKLLADQHAACPWVYAREIDQWWNEDNYACVTVRGVEYQPEIEDEPAAILETVVNYELRRWEGRWILWSWSQGLGSVRIRSGTG